MRLSASANLFKAAAFLQPPFSVAFVKAVGSCISTTALFLRERPRTHVPLKENPRARRSGGIAAAERLRHRLPGPGVAIPGDARAARPELRDPGSRSRRARRARIL